MAALNEFLAKAQSHVALVAEKGGGLQSEEGMAAAHSRAGVLVRRWQRLLRSFWRAADFELVRECESEECVLWFYDRT